mgnify:CR=1 FL=1
MTAPERAVVGSGGTAPKQAAVPLWQYDPGFFAIAAKQHRNVADSLDQLCSGAGDDLLEELPLGVAVGAAELDLDEFMRFQCAVDFMHDILPQPVLTNADDSFEMVRPAAQGAFLCRGNLHGCACLMSSSGAFYRNCGAAIQ